MFSVIYSQITIKVFLTSIIINSFLSNLVWELRIENISREWGF